MAEPQQVEDWPGRYVAKCSVSWCRQRATTVLRYLDNRGQFYRHTEVWETHARELCAGMKVIERER
jgi:hypothetical protein